MMRLTWATAGSARRVALGGRPYAVGWSLGALLPPARSAEPRTDDVKGHQPQLSQSRQKRHVDG
jgi:hypothetical protein